MKITVAPQRHAGLVADNRTHFLLADATVEAKVGLSDGSFRTVQGTKGSAGPGSFSAELRPEDLPAGAAATMVDLTYTVPVTLGGVTFTALRIAQRLLATAPPDGEAPDYRFAPGGWFDALGRLRTSNLLTHPLVSPTGIASGRVEVNTLMLDITDGWWALHRDNPLYALYRELMRDSQLTMRVLSHTGGTPLIWHAVIPRHLVGATVVSPHIFLQPSDNREGQNVDDDRSYLTRNDAHFKQDGGNLLRYLLPPIADVDVARLRTRFAIVPKLRNVLGISRIPTGPRKGQITPRQWYIAAGIQRAFEHRGEAKPAQFLLVPQRTGLPGSDKSGWFGAAVTGHVLRTTDAVLSLIQTNTALTLHGGDTLLLRGKLIYTGFSESGFDLWNVGKLLGDHLKALIGIEPQNINVATIDYRASKAAGAVGVGAPKDDRVGEPPALGNDVIPGLLKKGVRVVIIGRHHQHYRPRLRDPAGLRLLPESPGPVFRYPPDPAANDFIKYRIRRLVDPSADPLMTDEERAILADLAARGITGPAAVAAILTPESNADARIPDGLGRWYSHQFALSGGDELTADPAAMYGTPVEYRTWFQVAVHEIG